MFFLVPCPSLCFKYSTTQRKTCALTSTCDIMRTRKKQPKKRLQDERRQAKSYQRREFFAWTAQKSVKIKENSSKLLNCCPVKAKTSQKLLISLHFSVLSGKNRLIYGKTLNIHMWIVFTDGKERNATKISTPRRRKRKKRGNRPPDSLSKSSDLCGFN